MFEGAFWISPARYERLAMRVNGGRIPHHGSRIPDRASRIPHPGSMYSSRLSHVLIALAARDRPILVGAISPMVKAGTRVAPEVHMAKSRRKNEGGVGTDRGVANDRGGVATETAPQSVGDTTAGDIDRERVARRAYELYLARGGGDGLAMEDWLAAEREVRLSISDTTDES
jgi:hypothetical protein